MSVSRLSFPRRLLLLILLVNLFVIGLVSLMLLESHRLHYREAEIASQNLALALENSLIGTFEQHDVALLSVLDEIARQQQSGGIDAGLLNAFIDRTYSRLPKLNGLRIADENGYFVWGVKVDPKARANIADRDYFIRHRDASDAGLFISKPVVSRVDKRWAIAFARRVNHPDGSFAGVANTSIALEEFVRMFSVLDVGRHGVIAMRDANLAIIARHPEPEGVGSTVGNASVSQKLRELVTAGYTHGTYARSSGFDRIHRVFSFRRVGDYPFYIIVGLASQDFLGNWWTELARAAVIVLVFAFASVVAARLIQRSWHRQEQALADLRDSEATLATRNRELAEARDQAIEAMRVKSLFLAGVSHDLRHPMSALGLYLGYLKAQPEGFAKALPGMEQALGGMGGLLSRLLELSRIESGETRLEISSVDLASVLRRSVEQFQTAATDKGISLRCRTPKNAVVDCDAAMLRSIVDNLLGNAVRYTKHGGVLAALRRRGAGWRLEVWDTGPGIEANKIPLLFDAYRRFDDTHAKGEEGYGLGLTLVRQQCERLGYTITVRSRVGRGSVFAVDISSLAG